MAHDPKRYNPTWRKTSKRIRFERAGGVCEKCGAPHCTLGRRLRDGRFVPLPPEELAEVNAYTTARQMTWQQRQQFYKRTGRTYISISAAHLDHSRRNDSDRNLAALCQRCHIKHDGAQHSTNSKYGRNRARTMWMLPFGTLPLFDSRPPRK